MPKALIHELGKSKSFGRLSLLAKVLWPMLLSTSDDQGRGEAEADTIKWYVCPNVPEITADDVPRLLAEMADQKMIRLYEYEGSPVYQAIHWWEYQQLRWARPSKWAPPEGWTDRIRYSNRGDIHDNDGWYTTGGFDAEPLETAKARSGKKPPDISTDNSTENCTEPSQKTVETSNLTQPNLTQLNPTQPNLTSTGQATSTLQVSQPALASLGPDPPPLQRRTITTEQLEHPDPALAQLWQRACLPELEMQYPKQFFASTISRLRPICIEQGCLVLGGPSLATEQYTETGEKGERDQIPLLRTLRGIFAMEMGVQIEGLSFAVMPQPGGT